MRKIKFYSFIAVVGAMALSVSSCTKDLEDDVDQLKKDVAENKSAIAALDQAIKAGKLITDVKAVANGFDITFSDGTKITVNHGNQGPAGENGKPGADGKPGDPGADGKPGADAFAPIIGIDSENYWTVVTSEGGTAERILVDGKPVKAVGTANVEVKDGYLWIDGVQTALGGLPTVVINEVQGTALITMYDENGEAQQFTVLLAGKSNLIAISTPTAKKYEINVSTAVVANTLVGGTFNGLLSKGQVIVSSAFPILVSPANTDISNEKIVLINTKGEEFPLTAKATPGYDKALTRSASPSGLWTVRLTAQDGLTEDITAMDFVAVKIGNIQSSFDYEITKATTPGFNLTGATKTLNIAAGKTISFVNTKDAKGVTVNSSFGDIDPAKIYKSEIKLAAGQEHLAAYLTIDQANRTVSSLNSPDAIRALSAKGVKFIYNILDFTGASEAYPNGVFDEAKQVVFTVTYHGSNVEGEYNLPATTYTLNSTKNSILYDLKPLFDGLGDTETSTWRANASNFTVKAFDSEGTDVTASGFTVTYVKADGTTTTTSGADVQNIKIEFDNSKVFGAYKLVFSYTDSRGIAPFIANINLNVVNPAILLQKNNLFNGNKIVIYGDDEKTPASNKFDLEKGYTIPDYATVIFSTTAVGATINNDKNFVLATLAATDTDYEVKVKATYFGNAKNTIEETISVAPRSAIEHGTIALKKDKKFELEYNANDVKVLKLSEMLDIKDANGKEVVTFGANTITVDPRIDGGISVEVDPTNANASLIAINTLDTKDKTVSIVYLPDATKPTASFTVPVIIKLTDKYNKIKTQIIDFKVVIK